MIQIREGSFETNSSSTHNVVIVEDSQLEKWKNGDLFFIQNENRFVSKWEADRIMENVYGKLVLEYADSEHYCDEIVEAIKNKTLKDYVKKQVENENWYVDYYDLPVTFEEWKSDWDNRDLESDYETYITPKNEKIHIYCQYGYEG